MQRTRARAPPLVRVGGVGAVELHVVEALHVELVRARVDALEGLGAHELPRLLLVLVLGA